MATPRHPARLGRLLWLGATLLLGAGAAAAAGLSDNPADYRAPAYVLEIMADSRRVRELKSAPEDVRAAFTRTLRQSVYDKVDQTVVEQVSGLPAYQGKKLLVHEFRTPGSDPNSINADRDARLLVEAEPGRWVEVPRKHWEDTFYQRFGELTNRPPGESAQAHAGRYRQLATDAHHREASLDYTDQNVAVKSEPGGRRAVIRDSTIAQARDTDGRLLWDESGKPVLVSDTRIQQVKAAETIPAGVEAGDNRTRLRDAEGLGYMYFEKGDEQLRSASDQGGDPERRRMHQAEAAVQIGKGARSLDSLREAYARQGYEVGELPENFRRASTLITAQKGDLSADPDRLHAQLQALGFERGLDSFNARMRGQIEALKLAPRRQPSPARASPDPSRLNAAELRRGAARGAGAGGKLLEVLDFIETTRQAEQSLETGQNLYISLERDDGRFTRLAKIYATALLETTGIPGAMEAGWEADSAEKARIEAAIRRGETIDPLLSSARVITDVGTKAVKSTVLDPVQATLDKGKDIAGWAGAVWRERGNLGEAELQAIAAADARHQRLLRENRFNLGLIRKWAGEPGDERLVSEAHAGDVLSFDVARDGAWSEEYEVSWRLDGYPLEKTANAADPRAHVFVVNTAGLPAGEHELTLTVRARVDGKVHGQERERFTLSAKPGLGLLTARLDELDGPPLDGPIERGRIVAFDVEPRGRWDDSITVEWLVNGEIYKSTPGGGAKAALIRFRTDRITGPGFKLAIRLLETASGKILAYQERQVRFAQADYALPPVTLRAARDDYGGPPLDGPVRNGEVLAFSAEADFPAVELPPVINLSWAVLDAAGRPQLGLAKSEQVAASAGRRQFGFKFRPTTLANGAYTVVLTQTLATDPSRTRQSKADFRLFDSVRIERLVVSADTRADAHRDTLYTDETPHLFAYYQLHGGDAVQARLTVTGDDGRLLFDQTLERPRKGEGVQRVGLRLERGALRAGHQATFRVALRGADGGRAEASRRFRVADHQLGLSVPDRLKSGELTRFTITPPDYFTPPFRVQLDSQGAVAAREGALGGTLTGIAQSGGTAGVLKVTLTDASQRTAVGSARFTVGARVTPIQLCASGTSAKEKRRGGVFRVVIHGGNRYGNDNPTAMVRNPHTGDERDLDLIMAAERPACVELHFANYALLPPVADGQGEHHAIADYPVEFCGRRLYVVGELWLELNRRFKPVMQQRIATRGGVAGFPTDQMVIPRNMGNGIVQELDRLYRDRPIYLKEEYQGAETRYCLPSRWPD